MTANGRWDLIRRLKFNHVKSDKWSSSILDLCVVSLEFINLSFSVVHIFYCYLIFQVILALGDFMNVQCHACIGGTNLGEDIRKLDYGQHVVSGTPGRVFGIAYFSSLLIPSHT